MPTYKTAIHDTRRSAHEVLCGVLALDVAGDAGVTAVCPQCRR